MPELKVHGGGEEEHMQAHTDAQVYTHVNFTFLILWFVKLPRLTVYSKVTKM